MKLKVCGVRNKFMAQKCQAFNVDYIGLNFVTWSKRKFDSENHHDVIDHYHGKKVGIFMDQSFSEIKAILNHIDLDIIQLHGEEKPEFLETIRQHFPLKKIWKAFRINSDFDIYSLDQWRRWSEKFLFDGSSPGAGISADSEVLKKAIHEADKLHIPYGIAGGINPDNIFNFVKQFPRANFLDTASGVETNGDFDPQKLEKLIRNFRNAFI